MSYLIKSHGLFFKMRDLGTGEMVTISPDKWARVSLIPDWLSPYGNNECVIINEDDIKPVPEPQQRARRKKADNEGDE